MEKWLPHCSLVQVHTLVHAQKVRTNHANHTLWQDVYRPKTEVRNVYLKLMVVDDLLIVSFKEL